MNLKDFAVLADENIDLDIINFLRTEGFEVFSIQEEALFGLSDIEILKQSFSKKQIVLTQDSDFGTLIFRDKINFTGIFYLRPGHFSSDFHITTIQTVLSGNLEVHPPFILVTENTGTSVKIRLRSLA